MAKRYELRSSKPLAPLERLTSALVPVEKD